jgi:hypothetical protein
MRHLNVNTKHRKQRVLSLRVRFHVFRSLTIFHGFVTNAWNAPRGLLAVLNLGLACMIEWIFLKELLPTVDTGWPSYNLVKGWQKGFLCSRHYFQTHFEKTHTWQLQDWRSWKCTFILLYNMFRQLHLVFDVLTMQVCFMLMK